MDSERDKLKRKAKLRAELAFDSLRLAAVQSVKLTFHTPEKAKKSL